jgi:hypothetical protein
VPTGSGGHPGATLTRGFALVGTVVGGLGGERLRFGGGWCPSGGGESGPGGEAGLEVNGLWRGSWRLWREAGVEMEERRRRDDQRQWARNRQSQLPRFAFRLIASPWRRRPRAARCVRKSRFTHGLSEPMISSTYLVQNIRAKVGATAAMPRGLTATRNPASSQADGASRQSGDDGHDAVPHSQRRRRRVVQAGQ